MKESFIQASLVGSVLLVLSHVVLASNHTVKAPIPGVLADNGGYYVCYKRRKLVKLRSEHHLLVYQGCFWSRSACNSQENQGASHFGYYSNRQQAEEALKRCEVSKPRYVD